MEKNTHFKAHQSIKKMLVILGVIFFSVFFIGTVSAVMEWDNSIKYEEKDMKVTLTNNNFLGLGDLLGYSKDLGTFELKSHTSTVQIIPVGLGQQVVMYYESNFTEKYEEGLGKVYFTDMKTKKEIERDYTFVYQTTENYIGDILDDKANIIGTENRTRNVWKPYNSLDISQGNQVIGVQINVQTRDWVDVIWTIGGMKIDKHAQFTEVLTMVASNSTESTMDLAGLRISVNFDSNITTITKYSLTTATNVSIYFRTGVGQGSLLSSSTFSGDNATFNQAINTSSEYLIVMDDDGASYTRAFFNADPGFVVSGTHINGVSAVRIPSTEFTNRNENVLAIYTVNGSLDGPVITLNTPINAFSTTNPTINFNGTVTSPVGIANVTLFIDGILNETNSSGINDTDYLFTKIIEDGNHNWTYESCNSDGCLTATRTFTIDTIFPIVQILSPTGDQGTFASGRNLTLSWNVTDANPHTCIYEYDGVNTTVACSLNITNLTVTDSTKTSLIFYVNDTLGQSNFNTTSWSYSFIENDVTFNENASETSLQFFEMNLSTGLSVLSISANLNYDGTNYFSTSACGDFCLVNNTIDIPLVSTGESELKSFFWDINIFNGTDSINVNTTTRTQNVSRIHLETCDGTFTTQSLNFTTYNEQNLSRISPFTFDGTFDIWLGSGNVKRNNSFSDSSIVEKTLCIFPNATYFVDSEIQYNEPGNTTYITRDYYFQNDTINNVSQDIFLYLLPSSISTSFILKVQDTNLLPLENYLIIIQRFYPGENLFRTVQIARTGANGKTVGFFETETVDYRFIIKRNGRTLLTTTQQKIVGEVAPFTITFTLGEDLGKPWETLENLTNFQYSLDFEKSTNIVTYTYTDTSGNFTLGTLVVERQNFSFVSNTVLCNIDSSQSSATITCNLTGNGTGTYVAKGFVTRGNIETLINQFNFIIESFSQVAGFLGVLLAWFLILISSFAFKFNEIAGIFMINATVIFVNIIGLVSFGMLAISALIGVSIIIAVVMEK